MVKLLLSADGKVRKILIDGDSMVCFKCGRKILCGEEGFSCEFNKNVFCVDRDCKLIRCDGYLFSHEHIDFRGVIENEFNNK